MYIQIIIKKILLSFFTKYKNEHKEHKFCREKNEKSDFFKNQKLFRRDDIDVNKILVSKKEPHSSLSDIMIMMLLDHYPQMIGHTKKINENVTTSFRANNKHFL